MPVNVQRGTAQVLFSVNSDSASTGATAGDPSIASEDHTINYETTLYNGSTAAIRGSINLSASVNISNTEATAPTSPVPEPSTWCMLGLGLVLVRCTLKGRIQRR
jgi:hypothetical protein